MAYLDSSRRPSPGGMAAVIGIHVAAGAALVLGLTVTGAIEEEDGPLILIPIDPPKPPPPTDTPPPQPRASQTPDRPVVVPSPRLPIPQPTPDLKTTTEILPPLPPLPPGRDEGLGKTIPSPTPSFAAVAAKPRNDPNRWVSTDDYRNNWIRQEMTGKARFRLEIAADGRVNGCTIIGSSGHPELDAATCALVTKRARFQPARGSEGEPVAGSYSNAIDWQLPE